MFLCKNLGTKKDPKYFLGKDYGIECWTSSHLKWSLLVAVPSLVIWGKFTYNFT